jgi:hypothetical protein
MGCYSGYLRKMQVSYTSALIPVDYCLSLLDKEGQWLSIPLNNLLGKQLAIHYNNEIHCVACGRQTKKSFNQGHCYPCFIQLAACDRCIMSPEKCHYQQGTCREPIWAQENCLQNHYVYLANSSGLKVGITRGDQLPTRWIDQGAVQALAIFKVSQRYYSGLVETIYKQQISDRTQWQRMLKGQIEPIDLLQQQQQLQTFFSQLLMDLESKLTDGAITDLVDQPMTEILYPVEHYPTKVKSLNLDKQSLVEGTLLGIKGQYLILDIGVINIRKYSGYHIDFSIV